MVLRKDKGARRSIFGNSEASKNKGAMQTNGAMGNRGETSKVAVRRGETRNVCAMTKTPSTEDTTPLVDTQGRQVIEQTREIREVEAVVATAITIGKETRSRTRGILVKPSTKVKKDTMEKPAIEPVKAIAAARLLGEAIGLNPGRMGENGDKIGGNDLEARSPKEDAERRALQSNTEGVVILGETRTGKPGPVGLQIMEDSNLTSAPEEELEADNREWGPER